MHGGQAVELSGLYPVRRLRKPWLWAILAFLVALVLFVVLFVAFGEGAS